MASQCLNFVTSIPGLASELGGLHIQDVRNATGKCPVLSD